MLSHLFLLTGALAEMDGSSAAEQVIRAKRNCPMSPYATFLSQDQQETLHELVTEARQQGADESTVKLHIDKYISKILSPQRYSEFRDAYEKFEAERRGKRSTEEKKLPKKVYDLVDQYSGSAVPDYSKFYEDNVRKLRRL
ncbi:hypothetical protein OESDEN_18178 [Oesophagostomum dentatum]|uniref:Nematode fatty acid retinoid binding protein n=1 Tax=Oesophagostomum dentatum TaxID=61180 RepID=A0A0B1SG49_OESDE|nr:hypothetical protein OESDEN_18178 [Oesophagostomum dentatum]